MTSTSDLVTVMQKSIQIIENNNFDPILYQAIGLLYEYAGRHSGVNPQVLSPPRPSFQKSEVNDVIASGWLEEMTSPGEGSKQVVWKEALVVLTQKQGEEPCLWISREIMEGDNEPELETIHKIFTRRLHSCEYVDFYGDHRVSLRVRRKDNEIILRCQSAYAARAWVNELDAAKSSKNNSYSPSWRERRKSEQKQMVGDESVKQKKEKTNKSIEQKRRKEKEIENLQAAADSRRRREIELEAGKKAAAEKRRIEIEQKRKIAQEEQKRMEAEKKKSFLAEEQRKQDLIANAKKGKGKSTKNERKEIGKEERMRSNLSVASKYQKEKQQHQQDPPRASDVQSNSENKSSAQTNEEQSAQTEADIKYTAMANQVTRNGEEFLTTIKRSILSQWALQLPSMQSLRPLDELLCNIHTVYPPACGVSSHLYFTNWQVITSEELANNQGIGLEEEKVKKAVRKLRFFLHPDKLPHDLNEEQQFVCKLLWDVTNDAWDEYKKTQEDLNLLR
mmetsp:Transcript_27897/g.41172  ORF Transcript_27897/g.41172 Transcript_27897/m.41172 type:complete len:505 (+) Transcript_27897:44-1558(+)